MRIAAFGASLLLGASGALAQVPVTDGARVITESVTSETTERTQEKRQESNVKRTGSLCSVWRGGRGPESSLTRNEQITDLIRRVAREEGVAEHIALAISYQESRFNPCAKSHVGAYGLMQLMPGTAKDLGVNPHDPEQNVRGGLRYFKTQLRKFGSIELALAAYNAGPGNVRKFGGIPPFKETQGYVANITGKWIPKFGGLANSSDTLSSTRFQALSEPTMQSGGQAMATSESLPDVKTFLEGKALEAQQAGTLLDSMDANSDARIANLEMWNQAILTATSFMQLVNSLNMNRNMGVSGGAEFTGSGWQPGDPPPNDPFDPGSGGSGGASDEPTPPTIIIVGEPDGVCEDIGIEGAVDPDCVDDLPGETETVAAQDAIDALINEVLNPAEGEGVSVVTATPGEALTSN